MPDPDASPASDGAALGAPLPKSVAEAPPAGEGSPLSGPHGPGPAVSFRRALADAACFRGYLKPVRLLVVAVILLNMLAPLLRVPFGYIPAVLTSYYGHTEPASSTGGSSEGGPHSPDTTASWIVRHFSSKGDIFPYLGLVLICMLAAAGLRFLAGYWSAVVGEHLLKSVRLDVFCNLKQLSMRAVFARGPGQFVQRMTRDMFYVRDFYTDTMTQIVGSLLQVVVFVVFMFASEPLLTVALIALFALVGPPVLALNRGVQRRAGQLQRFGEEVTSQLVESIGGYRDIMAAGHFDRMADRFHEVLSKTARTSVTTTVWAQSAGMVIATATSVMMVIPYFAKVHGITGPADVGRVITYVIFLSWVIPALSSLARSSSNLSLAAPSLRAVRELLGTTLGLRDPTSDQPVTVHTPEIPGRIDHIRFENVGLNIDGRWLVDDLNFEIPGGRLTAIIGQSGAGKTTIFHLLLRLMRPTKGRILINDQPLEEIDETRLRRLLGFIPQNPFIFNQSLRENLLIAMDDESSDVRLQDIVELAQLGEVIRNRQHEGGLESKAGYLGMRLSGGERQRIALGRLLLQDPQVIVCDEYTANIDVKTAELIQNMMKTRFSERTRIVITHELFSVRGADQIIVLDEGRVVQQGTHDSLSGRSGLYQDLWRGQRLED